ncbi:hypothetical protein [Lichenicola sp.]|uniref:hypothetical protein n=1 Tax=Lichenicola sp. TaxID=2804529 RepID=UPI003B00730B
MPRRQKPDRRGQWLPVGILVLGSPVLAGLAAPAWADADDRLVGKVSAAIMHNHLGTRPACLQYFVTRNSDPGIDRVDVSARHDRACGGDPQVDEHLFSVYVDQTTHQMASDAADPVNGTLKALPP